MPEVKPKIHEFDWVVLYTMFQDVQKPVTVKDVMARYGWKHGRAQQCLERLAQRGYLKKRVESFWNGMYYAQRFWYW